MSSFSGTISAGSITYLRLYGSSGSAAATFDVGTNASTLNDRNGGTFQLGALTGGASTTLSGRTSSGSGDAVYVIGGNNTDCTFAGTVVNGAYNATDITKVGTGRLTLTGVNTYTGSTTISNGVLALSAGSSGDGSIGGSASITIEAGAFLDVTGRSDGTLPLGSGQTLGGNGTLLGALDSSSGGTVAPGNSIGTLTVTNTITLGGTTIMELNRSSVPNCDQLVSSLSSINFGGTLFVTNAGPRLQANDTFFPFSGKSFPTTFSSLVLPNYYTWDTSNLGFNGSVRVTGVLPGPSISGIAVADGMVTLNATGGATNGPVIALTSTNVALPLANWTPVATNAFDANGDLSGLTFAVDPTAAQQFYTLEGE